MREHRFQNARVRLSNSKPREAACKRGKSKTRTHHSSVRKIGNNVATKTRPPTNRKVHTAVFVALVVTDNVLWGESTHLCFGTARVWGLSWDLRMGRFLAVQKVHCAQ